MNIKVIHSKPGYRIVWISFLILFLNGVVFAQKPDNIPPNANQNLKKPEFASDEIIVQFKLEFAKQLQDAARKHASVTGLNNIDNLNRKFGVHQIDHAFKFDNSPKTHKQLAEKYGLTRTFILKVPGGTNLEDAIKEFNAMAEVEYAEQNFLAHGDLVPNDPIYSQQWGLNNTGQAVRYSTGALVGTPGVDINAQLAWGLHTGSSSTVLSILDSGVDYNHPEFAGRIVAGYDFINNDSDPMDDLGHGTACAGIAAAAGNNGIGVAGVNWNCKIMPVKVLGSDNSGTWVQVANGITWAADNGADILSLSLGGSGYSETLENAVNYAFSLGCVILASRGNNNNTNLSYPASLANVIAVGALSPCNERKSPNSCDGENWWGSSYGADLEIMAPGTRIHTTDPLGSVGYSAGDYNSTFNGTSAACPFAAGTAALIHSYAPTLTNNEIRDILQKTAVDIETGYGRINAFAALNFAANAVPPQVALSASGLSFTLDPDQTDNDLFTITNNEGSNALSLFWNISYNPSCTWLSVNKTSGKLAGGANDQITVSINTTGLINGNYQCVLNINSNDPNNPIMQVTVDLIVNYLPPPEFLVSPAAITKTVNIGETVTDQLTIVNTANPGHLNLHWSAVIQGGVPGISISTASGTASPGASNSIQVTINAAGVSAGDYSGTINITTNDPDNILVQIPVELTVNSVAIGGQKLFVFNGSSPASIIRADLDGQNASQPYLGLGRPVDGAVDMVNRKLYYLDWSPNINIYRVDLDGANKELLLSYSGGYNAVVDIALDVQNNHMYFAQQVAALTYRINRANLDGSNLVTLADIPSRGISGLHIVPAQGKIYWAGNDANLDYLLTGIWRANLDLTNQEQLTTGAVTVRGLDLDIVNNEMYWYEARDLGGYNYGRYIRKATMDGQNGSDILSVEAGDVALDPVGAKVYWTEQGGSYPNLTYDSYRANTDGTNIEALGLWGYRLALDFSPAEVDNKPPVAPAPPGNLALKCASEVPEPVDLTAVDNFDGDITVSPSSSITEGTCINCYELVRTWTFTDKAGNTTSVNQTITVKDDVAPVLQSVLPADLNVQCASEVSEPVDLTALDNCEGLISVSPTIQVTPGTCDNEFVEVRTWTFTDDCGNTSSVNQTITVKDETPPMITGCPIAVVQIPFSDAGECYYTATGIEFDVSASDNCGGIVSFAYVLSGATTGSASGSLAGVEFNFGETTVVWTAKDICGNSSTCSFIVDVEKIRTITTFSVDPVSQQYSDQVEFEATVEPWDCLASGQTGDVIFYVGTQAMGVPVAIGSDGKAKATYSLSEIPSFPSNNQMSPGVKTVTAEFKNTNPAYSILNPTTELTITPENAIVEYVGTEFQATPGSTATGAMVELRVVLKSVPDGIGLGGDIRNACVSIEIDGVEVTSGLNPQLIDPSDLTTGVVTLTRNFDIGSADYKSFDVKVVADCYFIGEDQTVVTVYKPVGDFITGGGHIKPTLSAGKYASTPGLKTNFGFHVKFNKKGKNLIGGMNILFRQQVGDEIQLFQIKTNSMSSLGINIINPNEEVSEFVSKANLRNLTTGESLGGNLTLQVKLTDRGEPGTEDEIAITLWNGNVLLYSSEWIGTSTTKQFLVGGNLVVHAGFSLKSGEITTGISQEMNQFEVDMYPNPSRGEVTLKITSSEILDSEVIVQSITGSEVFRKEYKAVELIKIDLSEYVSGIYLVTLQTGDKSIVKKLILDRK
jgi:subtilisin family serine protease